MTVKFDFLSRYVKHHRTGLVLTLVFVFLQGEIKKRMDDSKTEMSSTHKCIRNPKALYAGISGSSLN